MSSIPSIDKKIDIYINNNPSLKKILNTPLWKSYDESQPEAESYAKKIINAKSNPVGDIGLLVYGQISGDSPQIQLSNKDGGEETFDLVSDPYEYYFTDLVFIQQKYEEALIDLYLLKQDYFISTNGYSEIPQKIEEAIQDTLWIAEQNGVNISKEEILAKFTKELDERIAIIERELNVQLGQYFPAIIHKYSTKIAQATKEYYLEPNNNTYNKLKNSFLALLNAIKEEPTDIYINGYKINNIIDMRMIISVVRNKSGLYIPLFKDDKTKMPIRQRSKQ